MPPKSPTQISCGTRWPTCRPRWISNPPKLNLRVLYNFDTHGPALQKPYASGPASRSATLAADPAPSIAGK